jgi:hypothetical protein
MGQIFFFCIEGMQAAVIFGSYPEIKCHHLPLAGHFHLAPGE